MLKKCHRLADKKAGMETINIHQVPLYTSWFSHYPEVQQTLSRLGVLSVAATLLLPGLQATKNKTDKAVGAYI